MASFTSSGVVLGVSETLTPYAAAYSTKSNVSGRFRGSPLVNTKTGYLQGGDLVNQPFSRLDRQLQRAAPGLRRGTAVNTSKSQAWVTSQITMKGRSVKSIIPLGCRAV
jgi:hypothetical protein